ncbi:CHY zinc finger protein [Halorubrum laminariae]|uniref:CHY zinc finger protein n=1 Tax=Halorubrum laminariae TaxID=1433523 RepID=A0ABD6BW81_9EURY|nr:CHY zinc finger protein [Halorubrum laminariae]
MDTSRTDSEGDGGDAVADGDRERRTTTAPDTDDRFAVPLRGVAVDHETRCAHWNSAVDVVALRFGCCGTYYPCDACHDAATDHTAEPWPRDRFDEPAVLCGRCRARLSVRAYLDTDDACPRCGVAFNPGCRAHADRYFDI